MADDFEKLKAVFGTLGVTHLRTAVEAISSERSDGTEVALARLYLAAASGIPFHDSEGGPAVDPLYRLFHSKERLAEIGEAMGWNGNPKITPRAD